nr:carbohydrate kinase [Microbacterium indicum]
MTDSTVLVVGEALIDIVTEGGSAAEHVGGSPANVALGLGRAGVDAALLTQVGDDDRGRRIVRRIEESGSRVLPASVRPGRTSTAHATIGADGSATYAFDISWGALPEIAAAPALLHTGSIAAFLEPGADAVLALIDRLAPAEVTFDPNIRAALVGEHAAASERFAALAERATVVKMSDEDAAWLFPGLAVDAVIDRVLTLGPRLVAVTLGADGSRIATAAERVSIAPVSVDAVDTIGAGDTFMASLIASIVAGGTGSLGSADLRRIGDRAAAAAAITVSRAGADLPWASELA